MSLILVIIATFISTILGGLFAIKLRDKLHLILGFSAGAVLGVALFDLLPESIDLTTGVYSLQVVSIVIAAGFSVYMLVDRIFSLHSHNGSCENPTHSNKLGASALIFHSFLDGFGIGLAFKVSPAVGWVVAAAVLAHDFSDGINTVGMVIRDKNNQRGAIKWLFADAIAPAIGVMSTYFITISEHTLGLLLAAFVGLFLYISTADLIPESHHRHPAIWTTLMTIFGMAVIYVVVSIAG